MILHLHHIKLFFSEPLPQAPTKTLTHRKYTRRAIRIAQSKALSPTVDEPASFSRDDKQGEAFPTVSSLDVGQDRENIAKTSAFPYESSPRVPSFDADEGRKSQVSRGQRKKKCRAYLRGCSNHRGISNIREDLGADKSTKLGSNDTEEMVNVLSSMEAVNILLNGGATAGVSTVSGSFPTPMRIPIIGAKDKGKEKRLSEQLARDSEIARLHDEEELKMMIEGLNRSNEVIAKHLREYEQAEADFSVGEKLKLISELVKHQDHRAKILKGMTLEQIKEKFIPVWKQFKDFVPMSSKEESKRGKRQGLRIDQGSSKRIKISEEELKGMMQLVPLEEVYIKALQVMQAYNATSNESLIPPQAPNAPPTILPPSPVLPLSPMFDPQDFFLPEEILPP
uniref:Reverse transcriptase domain-containing protein n=1 Tax=Tanacetum cinerariifolium TaxID=118510 RepID=A0A699I2E6_TANCI|nr:hypothetical protein [Tanacetum cinerariifolium]